MALVLVVGAVAGVLVYVLGTRGANPRARLERAIVATRTTGTAAMTLHVDVQAGGTSFGVTATGTVDFSTNAVSLHMNALGKTLGVVEVGGTAYVKLGSYVSSAVPGKTWLSVPVATISKDVPGSTTALLTDDPSKLISTFAHLGGTVTTAGTKTIDGSVDHGYRIDLSVADIVAHASELPASVRSLFATATKIPKTGRVTVTVYVDPAGRMQASDVLVDLVATGHPVNVSLDMTLSDFGTAAAPSPPPATQTVTYQQFTSASGLGQLPTTVQTGAGTAPAAS